MPGLSFSTVLHTGDIMTNIVAFRPKPRSNRAHNLTALLAGLAGCRRRADDVFWLKENAEALSVLAATGTTLLPGALTPYEEFYDGIEEKLRFYPQYYRFFLSLCLDLEDLGIGGSKGASLCRWAASTGLAGAELSDLQRAEAQRLLSRRGAATPLGEGELGQRLRAFIARADTFALPNKKAAYELTHIVFYLSEYGRVDPRLDEEALTSLEFAGVLAFLDQNHDLLAEVCVAMRYAGRDPSPIWTQAVTDAHAAILPTATPLDNAAQDAYHPYLVTGWAQLVLAGAGFEAPVPEGALHFAAEHVASGALRPLSECLLDLGQLRSSEWDGMRGRVIPYLDQHSRHILHQAEASTSKFDAFFRGFARVSGADLSLAG